MNTSPLEPLHFVHFSLLSSWLDAACYSLDDFSFFPSQVLRSFFICFVDFGFGLVARLSVLILHYLKQSGIDG